MENPLHHELEVKFAADGMNKNALTDHARVLDSEWTSFKTVAGRDDYWRSGSSVIRHRHGGDKNSELTVKLRKSQDSITNRHEVDLALAVEVAPESVNEFLSLSGYHLEFGIEKVSYIYHLTTSKQPSVDVVYALYDVWALDTQGRRKTASPARFFEIEIEKSGDVSMWYRLQILNQLSRQAQKAFGLDQPLNTSLYEMYRPK